MHLVPVFLSYTSGFSKSNLVILSKLPRELENIVFSRSTNRNFSNSSNFLNKIVLNHYYFFVDALLATPLEMKAPNFLYTLFVKVCEFQC